ncbi:MAG: hypothetical protein RL757_3241 [Bacteroidota bacterium]
MPPQYICQILIGRYQKKRTSLILRRKKNEYSQKKYF